MFSGNEFGNVDPSETGEVDSNVEVEESAKKS